jgi:hypothetical protein
LVNKRFFDAWCERSGFSKTSFSLKKEDWEGTIDNEALFEPKHTLRLKDEADFVVLPKVVFFPLSQWYKCNRVIERKVISYSAGLKRRNTLTESQKLNGYSKTIGDTTYELELKPKFIYFEKISEKGERPH